MGQDKSPYIGQVENEQGIQTPKMQSTFPSALCEVGAKHTSLPEALTTNNNIIITYALNWDFLHYLHCTQ